MEAEINSGAKGASYEFDMIGVLLGNQSAHETTPYWPSNGENQVDTSFGNANGRIMSNNPSEVPDDPNMLQLDRAPRPLNTLASADQFQFPVLPNPAPEVQNEKSNSPQLLPFPSTEVNLFNQLNDPTEYNFQPDLFMPQQMAPVDPQPTFGGNRHGQFIPMYPQPQMWTNQQQQPPNEQLLSLNANAPRPQNLPNNQLQLHNQQVPAMPNAYNFTPPGPSSSQRLPQLHPLPPPPPHQVAGTPYYTSLPNPMLPWYQQQPFNPEHQSFSKRMSISEFLATPFNARQLEQERSFHLQLLNSGHHIYQDKNGNRNIRIATPLQLDTVPVKTKRKGKGTQRPRKTAEKGESSQKRKKVGKTAETQSKDKNHETGNNDGNSNAADLSNPRSDENNDNQNKDVNSNAADLSNPRPEENHDNQNKDDNSNAAEISNQRLAYKSAIYDPAFETIGLPIDPHLRMFTLF
ncbi:hypothetical protein M5689_025189 [Euphorbia peplus]|nr:hypothetical protein M5689_025189 [Euphorbia peplus]